MVTHNPELAQEYSTRIIKILDGVITDDSKPFTEQDKKTEKVQVKNGRKNIKIFKALIKNLKKIN